MPECINLMIFSVSAATKTSLKLTDMIGSPRGAETKPKSGFSCAGNHSYSSLISFHEKPKLFICVPSILLFRVHRATSLQLILCGRFLLFTVLFSLIHICRHIHMYICINTLIRSLATWWLSYSAEVFEFVSNT